MKILCISDHVESMLHGPTLNSYAGGVEAVISCGDLVAGTDASEVAALDPNSVELAFDHRKIIEDALSLEA